MREAMARELLVDPKKRESARPMAGSVEAALRAAESPRNVGRQAQMLHEEEHHRAEHDEGKATQRDRLVGIGEEEYEIIQYETI